jgi:Arc/MetJ family transcription regulator
MERTETRIDRSLVKRARERARKEGSEESDVIEDALRRYLGEAVGVPFGEVLDSVAWQREHGVEQLSEEEAIKLAVEEQHASRRGE